MSGLWVGLGTAALGAYSANRQASAANKSKTAWTDQTTTQDPYFAGQMNPDIEEVLTLQRGLVQQGVPQLDKHGNIIYSQPSRGTRPGPVDGYTPANDPRMPKIGPDGRLVNGGGNGNGGVGGRVDRGPQDDGDLGQFTPIASPSSAAAGGGKGSGKGKGKGKGNKGAGTGAGSGAVSSPSNPVQAGPNLSTPQGIFTEVAKRGLDAGNTGTQTGARNLMENIWGAGGRTGGSSGAGEETGFEGYNPILDRQAQRLEGDANSRVARDLIMNFLGENNRAGAGAGSSAGSGTRGGYSSVPSASAGAGGQGGANIRYKYQSGTAQNPTAAQQAQILPPASAGVPDTFAGSPDSYFETETRKVMDEQANEAELQSVIDAMNADVERGMFRDLAQLDATAAGSGRFGGSTWAALNRDAREEALQEMLKTGSQVRVGDRESRRQARLAALAGVNQRDLGLLGANVQREGIAAGERSANAAAGAGARAAADQLELAKRGQDLAAISDLLGYEQFGMGQLTDIGGQLSGDRLGSLGMVPGLEGIGLSGLNTALGAGGGMVDMRGQDVQSKIAGQQAGIARQGLNQQLGMFNASQGQGLVNNYLGTLMNIGQMGGTSRTQGQNVMPGLGVSPSAATLQGAAGGFLTGYGTYNQYR